VEELLCKLLNVHNVSDVRQIEIHTAEPLIPGPSHLEVEISIAKPKKYKWEYNGMVHQLFKDFKKTYDSVRRELLYNILILSTNEISQVDQNFLNETYNKVHTGKHFSDSCPIKNYLRDVLSQLLYNSASEHGIRKVKGN
jgi:hypothetical protein